MDTLKKHWENEYIRASAKAVGRWCVIIAGVVTAMVLIWALVSPIVIVVALLTMSALAILAFVILAHAQELEDRDALKAQREAYQSYTHDKWHGAVSSPDCSFCKKGVQTS